jgi:hypothetical protein
LPASASVSCAGAVAAAPSSDGVLSDTSQAELSRVKGPRRLSAAACSTCQCTAVTNGLRLIRPIICSKDASWRLAGTSNALTVICEESSRCSLVSLRRPNPRSKRPEETVRRCALLLDHDSVPQQRGCLLMSCTIGRRRRFVNTTKAAASALATNWPASANIPTIAEHQSVAAVLRPRMLMPSRSIPRHQESRCPKQSGQRHGSDCNRLGPSPRRQQTRRPRARRARLF